MTGKMKVDVSSSSPILWMDVSTDDFGRLFAGMAADQQVDVLRSMFDHMKPHAIQWDFIALEIAEDRNADLLRAIKDFFGSIQHE